jgi:hypothetical protein
MTQTTRNEAAELRAMLETMDPRDAPNPSVLVKRLDAALAAERRLTVERIKGRLFLPIGNNSPLGYVSEFELGRILDDEAAQ